MAATGAGRILATADGKQAAATLVLSAVSAAAVGTAAIYLARGVDAQ
jgi:hypothetical protein